MDRWTLSEGESEGDSQTVAQEEQVVQHFKNTENSIQRKVGIEVVKSADMTSRFYHGPRRQRHVFAWSDNDAWAWRVARAMR